jgi:membrane protein implicated in regulation of membrane protease activity
MSRAFWTRVAHAFRRTALPLAVYYAVTLALPLANGAAQSSGFVKHALVVLVIPPVAVLVACVASAVASQVKRRYCRRRLPRKLSKHGEHGAKGDILRVVTAGIGLLLFTTSAFAQASRAACIRLQPYKPSHLAIMRQYGGAMLGHAPLSTLLTLDPYVPSQAELLRPLPAGFGLLILGGLVTAMAPVVWWGLLVTFVGGLLLAAVLFAAHQRQRPRTPARRLT